MRIGVIGVGRLGSFHAATLAGHEGIDVVVASRTSTRADEVAGRLGVDAAPIAEVLKSVDAVVIASATDSHAELVEAAVERELPTFCEKPLALRLDDTRRLVVLIEERGVDVQVGFQRRFDPGVREMRRRVADGSVGMPYVIRSTNLDAEPSPAEFIPSSGGMYRDVFVHAFDTCSWILGASVDEVFALGAVREWERYGRHGDVDTAAAAVIFADGTLGTIVATRHDPVGQDNRVELVGSEDSVAAGWIERTPVRSLDHGGRHEIADPFDHWLDRYGPAYRAEMAAFVDMVAGHIPNPCPPDAALRATEAALACERSREERRPVTIEEMADWVEP